MRNSVAILVNDIHLNKDNVYLVKNIFDQIIDLCNERQIDDVWIGGDVFTNRSGQPLVCLSAWKDIIDKLNENEIKISVIAGNHDKTDADDNSSYLDVYSDQQLFSEAMCVTYGRMNVVFIPYYKDEKWLSEFNRVDVQRNKNYKSILVTHIGFDGVRNNDGTEVESVIKQSLLKDYDKVLVGHYHNASHIGSNIYYTGSAYQNNFGENITDKGFTIVYDDATIEFVPSIFPKYIKETVEANDKETISNLIEKYNGEQYNHIRFVFTGKKEDCQNINIADIQGKYGIDCKFQSTEECEAINIAQEDSVVCYDKQSIIKDFFRFCSDNKINGEKMKFGLNLIKNI